MKKTKIFLKMAALAVMGTMMSGCAEEIETLQPANQSAVQKINISLADDAGTRGTIASDGKTSFSVGDQIAVIYQNTDGKTLKAESAKLTSADMTDEGASATFTVELNSPKAETKVRYIYPASMAAATVAEDAVPDAAATINTSGLATQDGTLATIASDLGLSVYDGTMSATATLPTGSGVILDNQLAIVKLNSIHITADINILANVTDLTIIDGTNTYTVSRTAAADPIYVAMLPTSRDITFSTIDNGYTYTKTATGNSLVKNKIYPINLAMEMDPRAPHALAKVLDTDLGSLVGADGNIYDNASQISAAGTTAIGVIAYIATTADDEIAEKSNGGGHGLVLCLKNAAENVVWSTEKSAYEFDEAAKVINAEDNPAIDNFRYSLKRLTNVSGYTNTTTLAAKDDASTKYPAAYQAKNYTGLTAPKGTTGWFLPSAQQWEKMQTALGELDENDIVWQTWFDTNRTAINKWDAALAKGGEGNYKSIKDNADQFYWSSSENSADNAVILVTTYNMGSRWDSISKTQERYTRVRPVLAF